MRKPSFSRYSAASCSPCLPRTSLGCMRTTSGPDIAGGRRAGAAATAELWKSQAGTRAACGRGVLVVRCRWLDTQLTPWRTADASRCSRFFWQLKVAFGQFLDVDILEGHDPDVLDEPGRPVHVPHPGVVHGDLEEHLAVVGGTDLEDDVVGEVEPALGLHHMGEEADDVAVLAIELELPLGLVLLEVLRAHVLRIWHDEGFLWLAWLSARVRPASLHREDHALLAEQRDRPPGRRSRDTGLLHDVALAGYLPGRRELPGLDPAAQPSRDLLMRRLRGLVVDLHPPRCTP